MTTDIMTTDIMTTDIMTTPMTTPIQIIGEGVQILINGIPQNYGSTVDIYNGDKIKIYGFYIYNQENKKDVTYLVVGRHDDFDILSDGTITFSYSHKTKLDIPYGAGAYPYIYLNFICNITMTPTYPWTPTQTVPVIPTPTYPWTPTQTVPVTPTPTDPQTPPYPWTPSPTLPFIPTPTMPITQTPTYPWSPIPTPPVTPTPTMPLTGDYKYNIEFTVSKEKSRNFENFILNFDNVSDSITVNKVTRKV